VTTPVPDESLGDGEAKRAPGGMSGPDGPLLNLVKDRRIAFLVVGAINTGVGFLWFTLFLWAFSGVEQFGYMLALLCSHVTSVLCAFVFYRTLVFRVRGHLLLDLARFEVVYLVSLGINAVLLPVLVEFAHLHPFVAQLLIVFVTTLVSYFGHKSFSFRRKPETPSS